MVRVRDVMSTDLVVVSPELPLRDLVELLAAEHIGGAPVVAGTRVVGVVTLSDVLSFVAGHPGVPRQRGLDLDYELEPPAEPAEGEDAPGAYFANAWADVGADVVARFEAVGSPEWDLFSEHTVAEVMSRKILSVPPDEELSRAARLMQEAGVPRLLVMEEGRLCGILTTSDVAGVVADQA